ncbi:MAG: LPS export ABC transporter permease LptF [Alphaproteobacteria bacterium]
MKKLDKYIFKQIFISFLLTVMSLMAIIWLTQSLRFLDFITDKGIGVVTFIEITSLLMPRIFGVISPIAVFACVLFVYNKMLSDRELVVIKAAGIAPCSLVKPAVYFGIILMICNFFVYNYGIGWAEKKFNELQWQIKNNISGIVLKSGEFNFLQNGLTIFVSKQNKDGSVEGVLINDETKPLLKKTIFAEFGRIVYNNQKPKIILVNGTSQEFNLKKQDLKTTEFDRYSIDIGSSQKVGKRQGSVRTHSFAELWNAPDDKNLSSQEQAQRYAEATKRILSSLFNVLFAFMGCIGLIVGGFNRRGQGKILAVSSVAMIFVQAFDLMIFSKASDNIKYVPLMYLNFLLPLFVCLFLLFFYRPKKVKKMKFAVVMIALFFSFNANAQLVGEIANVTDAVPYAEINPTKNLTSFLDEKETKKSGDVDFKADEIEHYKDLSTVVAMGNVQITKDNLVVYADKVVYNQKQDEITATGNVVLVEENGAVVFSEYAELTSKFSKAEMTNVLVVMEDQTRLSAKNVKKYDDNKKVLKNATYSPCDVCQGEDPMWQLRASKITHDEESKNIYYKNARLELGGVPVFYLPYFSHPDPKVKRRSGFLPPSIKSNTYLGASIGASYFWAIDDHQDVLFSPIVSTDKGVVYDATYKKYVASGYLELGGSFLHDDDTDKDRGVIRSDLTYEINDLWRLKADINYASDRTYLKDMSLPNDDDPWLTSEISLEGFNNRNYSSISAYYYNILSYELQDTNQPFIAPLFDYENYGNVGKYGAYTKTQFNAASVNRDDDDTSTQRFTMINSWVLPYTSQYGEKYKMQASLKSDAYYVSDYINSYDEEYTGAVARVFPQLGMEWRLPFIKLAEDETRHILEPVVVGVLASNGGQQLDKIPNEDSLDIRLDDVNILSLDRYSGYDRNDVGSRISYGLNWNSYGERFGRTAMFLAQTYNVNEDSDFATTDDENEHFSDYVGRVYAAPSDYLDLDYRYRLDKDDLSLKYSELGTTFGPSMLKFYVSYIYLDDSVNLDNTLYDYDTREEVYTSVRAKLSQNWSLLIYNRQDLDGENSSSLEHGGQLIYDNECTTITGYVKKENSSDPDLENDFEFGVNFLLKTLGGVGTK